MLQRLRDAAVALHRTTAERDELLRRASEQIAIVGMGCRFPGGVDDPESYWRLLEEGRDAIGSLDERWQLIGSRPAEEAPDWGGLLKEVDLFDAEFFGISPREAITLDPQHRLLLEVTWEALEDAGILPRALEGSQAGVFVGVCWTDYANAVREIRDDAKDAYAGTGNMPSVAAGRISYTLGLHGPCLTLDTACSSSLVTTHLACESLRRGECDIALAGGVNLLLSAETMTMMSRLQALSPQGRCRTFDASANGFVRGEGCGMLVLKRLSDAQRDGNRIWATIRGSAVNQDGRSNGLTAPNGAAQEALIRSALRAARLTPESVGYVEAHGTGTSLGDPIELEALRNVIGAPRGDSSRCFVGSVKTNLGHLEGAAGVAGLMKAVLTLSHGRIPKNLNFRTLNPRIQLAGSSLAIASEGAAWPRGEASRIAGVSSFGISGTNAHVILEERPAAMESTAPSRSAELVVLSARTEGALRAGADRLRRHLDSHPELPLGDVAHGLMTTRATMEHRLALSVPTREALLEALETASRGEAPTTGGSPSSISSSKVVFVFPGQGSQWLGMGRELLSEEPSFREAMTSCDRAIAQEVGWSVIEAIGASDADSLLTRVDVIQPVLFAMGVSLAALWRSWGVMPSAVVGHSMGEVAAACVSGALSLSDGAAVICRRSRLLRRIDGQGDMVLVDLGADEAHEALGSLRTRASVAVSNSLHSTVLSGERAAMAELVERLQRRGLTCRRVNVDYASHSPQVDPLLGDLVAALESLRPTSSAVPMHSTLTGTVLAGPELRAQYWADNLRQPVRFALVIQKLLSEGFTHFVEMSPHPILVAAVEELREGAGTPGVSTGSLRRDQPERLTLLESLARLYVHGHALDPRGLFPAGARRVPLPTYPWQRERYWVEPPTLRAGGGIQTSHPILGVRVGWAGAEAAYETVLSATQPPWLADHRVGDQVIVPATAVAELVRAAGEEHRGGAPCQVVSLVLQVPMVISNLGSLRVQLVLSERGTQASIYSQPAHPTKSPNWTLHATAELGPAPPAPPRTEDLTSIRRRCAEAMDLEATYEAFASMGLAYGSSFRGLRALWRGTGESLAEISLDPGVTVDGYGLHPALLDAGLQSILVAVGAEFSGDPVLPFELGRVVIHQSGVTSAVVHARLVEPASADWAVADVTVMTGSGAVIAQLERVRVRRAHARSLRAVDQRLADAMYRLDWQRVESAEGVVSALRGRWAVVAWGEDSQAQPFVDESRARGASSEAVSIAEVGKGLSVDHVLCVWGRDDDATTALDMARAGLAVVQALVSGKSDARLWWVTRGSMSMFGEPSSPAASSVWGLGRTVMREHPEIRLRLLEVEASGSVYEGLAREMSASDDETQVAWRASQRYVARLVRAAATADPSAAENYQLQARQKGTLDGLTLVPIGRRAPGTGEVEIEIASSGLNFRDVVDALGMISRPAEPLGNECSGVIRRLGAGVVGWSPGEEVLALASGAIGRFVTVDARLVARVPTGLSLEQASTVPVAFLTAWYALHDLGRLRRNERLLVHAAAGGVGMAAVQLAQWIGAEVLATASPLKWDVVRSLGVVQVGNSRDLSFLGAFRSTSSKSPVVDVVLNSLAGEFVDASLSLLSAGGRFIEMGKTDIRDASAVSASHPGVAYRAFDLMEAGPDRLASMLAQVMEGFESGRLRPLPVRSFAVTESEAAFRFMSQARHVGKLALRPLREPLRLDGSVLVTGGLGALGLQVARGLAERGVPHLVLMGRRGLETPGASAAVSKLEALGARVTVAAGDVADRTALSQVLSQVPPDLPLRGVVHAAGVLDDGVLTEQTADRFERVMRPKAQGAWNLHVLTERLDLDIFVMFSSIAGTLGSAGQSGYTAANAYLDGLAAHRRARGLAGASLAWGAWSEAGLASALEARERLARQGLGPIPMDLGLQLFERAIARPETQLVLAPLDLRALAKFYGASIPSLWRSLMRAPSTLVQEGKGGWALEVEALPSDKRARAVTYAVRAEVARVLGLGRGAGVVAEDRAFKELGLDSLMAVELRNALGRRAGVTLPATLAFDHPTPAAIAKYLLAEVLSKGVVSPTPVVHTSASMDDPIAIIGMGCRMPGGVEDPEGLWALLQGGVDAVREVPIERWDIDRWYDPDPDAVAKMATRWGGFVDGLELLEPIFFGLSPRAAPSVDPQERMLLETAWEALERAGLTSEMLMGSETGVYMGLCGTEYQARVMADASRLDSYSLLGTTHSTMVGRLSYWLGLKGPNMPVDTACSSSLVAVHLACQALRTGECRLALAGGANAVLDPKATVYFSRLGALSPTGRCRTFSSDADGYVRAEGAGVVVLERLSDAQRNGHPILALIRGSAVNQDGRSNGLTAPNGPSQQTVIRQALGRAGITPSQVGYVECHGTGTVLGDPIEVQALGAVLGEGRDPAQPVIIGSLKTNVGHMEGAAGVGGLMKAVLALQHGRIPKSLHFLSPNPHVAWGELPVKVASEALDWEGHGRARVAGVSSFGFSGTNAHVVLEEAPAVVPAPAATTRNAELVVLSARTEGALRAATGRLRRYLETHPELSLGDVAYSLATTRDAMEHRLAVAVPTRDALLAALEAAAEGETPAGAARGEATESAGKVAWLFSGEGSRTLRLGQELYGSWPAFRKALEEAWSALDPHLDRSLREVMWAEAASAGVLEMPTYAQPALFALQWALSALWRSWGVEPELLCGDSTGELTVACVAGVMSLADGARLVCARARLHALPTSDAVVTADGSEERAAPNAFRSPKADPMLAEFARLAESIEYRPATRALVSNVRGLLGSEVSTPRYWVRHVREVLRFGNGAEALRAAGAASFLEIGPKTTLLGLVRDRMGEVSVQLLWSLRPGHVESQAVLEALGGWFARGGHVAWDSVHAPGAHRVPLPTYPWQRKRYWIEAASDAPAVRVPSPGALLRRLPRPRRPG